MVSELTNALPLPQKLFLQCHRSRAQRELDVSQNIKITLVVNVNANKILFEVFELIVFTIIGQYFLTWINTVGEETKLELSIANEEDF